MRRQPDRLTIAFDRHVKATGRDPGVARREEMRERALGDGNARAQGKTFGQKVREYRRHVLNDQNRNRKVRRKFRDHLHEGGRTTGGHADR